MIPLILDFETFFSQQITLKKMNYTEYVPKAQPLCVSFLFKDELHFAADQNIASILKQIPWDEVILVGHNLLFDALVLKHWYGHQAHTYCDTLGLLRHHHPSIPHDLGSLAERFCPHIPKLKENLKLIKGKLWNALTETERDALKLYNTNDVLITNRLYEFAKRTSAMELALIDHTIKLWLNPVIILDKEKAQAAVVEEKRLIAKQLTDLEISKTEIRSDRSFSALLKSKGYNPPTKWSTKQNKEISAFAKTDSQFQEFYIAHPELQDLLDLKRTINSNIKESRTERLITAAALNDGKIPIAYNYHGAFTGRFCLTGDTHIYILRNKVILDILLPELLPADLVWDGESFVSHEGLIDQGIREVISYDNITGTPDHRVFVEEISTPIELRRAMEAGYTLKVANPPPAPFVLLSIQE